MIDTSLYTSNFYFLVTVIQGIVLSGLIVFQKPYKRPNLYFGILLFLFSSTILHIVLEGAISGFNRIFPFPMEFSMAYGPLAYLHILHIKNPLRAFKAKDLLHFVPCLIFEGLFFYFFFRYLGANPDWTNSHSNTVIFITMTLALLGNLHLLIYTLLIFKESKATRFLLKDFVKVQKWLKYLIISWGILFTAIIIAITASILFVDIIRGYTQYIFIPLGIIFTAFIYGLGYMYLLKYSGALKQYMDKAAKFSFTQEELEKRQLQLIKTVKCEELYKDPKLSIAKLAGHIGWPINDLSQILNEVMDTNFNDFINHYRVIAFKESILTDEAKKYSIVGLSQKVGFSSKASFYRVFKKETGLTPSEFMENEGL